MGPLALIGIGAGTGLLKSLVFDAPRASRQGKLAAETIRYSPWTGMLPQPVEEPNYFGSAIQGAALGGLAGQGLGLFNQATPLAEVSPTIGGGNKYTLGADLNLIDKNNPWLPIAMSQDKYSLMRR